MLDGIQAAYDNVLHINFGTRQPTMRINARLDEESARKLEYLKDMTHAPVTDVVKNAIDLYYQRVKQARDRAQSRLFGSGFVGCGSAEPDLSQTCKDDLSLALEAKHGHR